MAIADESNWKFVLTGIDGSMGQPGTGALYNTANKEFTYMINSARSAQVSVNIDNPQVDWAFENDCLMKVYRRNRYEQWQLMMVGDVLSVEESAQNDSGYVTITAADPMLRLQKRLLGVLTNSLGMSIPYFYGFATDEVTPEPIDISGALLLTLNYLNALNYTGVGIGSLSSVSVPNTYGPAYAVYFGDIIQQSCATLDGPDLSLTPCEPFGAWPHTQIGTLNFYNHLGSINPLTPAVFEYGIASRNTQAYDRLKTKANIANNILSLPQGFPSGVAAGDRIEHILDPTSFLAIGEYDYLMDSGDTISAPPTFSGGQEIDLRYQLIALSLQALSQAQNQITFTPSVDCNVEFGTDYGVGDLVQARAYDLGSQTLRFNGTARVYGVDIQIDENDAETPSLTLIPSTAASGNTTLDN
jgi:hypothetical protein